MTFFILTNNPRVLRLREEGCEVLYAEEPYDGILRRARDLIHQGHSLLTHPLSGSVKPGENPYKSIMLSSRAGALDAQSLELIENAIVTARKFPDLSSCWTRKILDDFMLIDETLISSALPSALSGGSDLTDDDPPDGV